MTNLLNVLNLPRVVSDNCHVDFSLKNRLPMGLVCVQVRVWSVYGRVRGRLSVVTFDSRTGSMCGTEHVDPKSVITGRDPTWYSRRVDPLSLYDTRPSRSFVIETNHLLKLFLSITFGMNDR